MVLRNLFDRLGRRRDEANENVIIGNDGWVEMSHGRLIVHDPAEDGRYATLTPEPGVRLWINDEEVTSPTAVTQSDLIRYEVAVDPLDFFELRIAEDEMSAELLLTADPLHMPDTVTISGRHQVRLEPGCSTRAKPRVSSPRKAVLDRLAEIGVTFGIDEAAIEEELTRQTGQPVVVARGQEPQKPEPGQWVWKLDEWSLVDAGQVIAAYQDGVEHKPRITVTGKTTDEYPPIPEPVVYLAGNGTRIVPGGRLVASASGRARPVGTPQGQRVHIFPVQRFEGLLTGDLETQGDLLVSGDVRQAKIRTTGELLVTGNVEKSEVRAELITIRGNASDSTLCTVAPGHHVSLRVEMAWLNQRLQVMREQILGHKPVAEDLFREGQNFLRAVRRKAEQMGLNQADYTAAIDEVSKVFLGAAGLAGVDLNSVGRMIKAMEKSQKVAEQVILGVRDVSVKALSQCTVWSGRNVSVTEKITSSSVFAGGDIDTPETATLSQSELVAGGRIDAGILSSVRGVSPVTLRAGGQIQAAEVQVGCAFEFGADRREFKNDLLRLVATPTQKGQLHIRQRD